MQDEKFNFYTEYKKMESNRESSVSSYFKSPLLIIIVIVLMLLTIRESTINSTKVGRVGDVGGSITIYNTDGKHVPKGHVNVTKYNRDREIEFLNYLELLDKHHINIKMMLVSLNDRIITLSDETNGYADIVDNNLDHTHITLWYKQCGNGYTAMNGSHIQYPDVKESFGKVMYPDLRTLIGDKNIIPCIYIGK